jgi:hypothetical protein
MNVSTLLVMTDELALLIRVFIVAPSWIVNWADAVGNRLCAKELMSKLCETRKISNTCWTIIGITNQRGTMMTMEAIRATKIAEKVLFLM